MAGELGMWTGCELPQSKPDGFDSSLGEGASGETGHFTVLPETLPPCQRPHPRGGWHRAAMTGGVAKRASPLSCSAALSQKAALQMPFPATTPPVKMRLERSAERDKREILNNSSAEDG